MGRAVRRLSNARDRGRGRGPGAEGAEVGAFGGAEPRLRGSLPGPARLRTRRERDPDGRLRARAAGDALRRAGHARGHGLRPRRALAVGLRAGRAAARPDATGRSLTRRSGLRVGAVRPPAPSPLYSGNTLATAVLGLSLFAGSLRLERHPAFLYMGFAAFFLAYFGAYYFLRDLLMAVEEAARQAMGYREKLPGPFRAINGLFFNTMLAALALVFSRRWKDERLARHCHYLGVPFSIAACVYSGFEPLAALLCLGGYFVLYLLGTWVFRAPWVQYLAIGALAAAAYFGSTLVPGITLGEQALAAGAIGLGCTCTALAMRWWELEETYRVPWRIGGLALSVLALLGSTLPMVWTGTVTFTAATTFLVVAITAALANLDGPEAALGYLSLLCANVAAGLGLVAADVTGRWSFGFDRYAIVAGACGLIQVGVGAWLGRSSRMPQPGRALRSFVGPLRHLGLIVAGLSLGLCAEHLVDPVGAWGPERLLNLALALGLSASAFAIGSAILEAKEALAYVAVWAAVAGYFFAVLGGLQTARRRG